MLPMFAKYSFTYMHTHLYQGRTLAYNLWWYTVFTTLYKHVQFQLIYMVKIRYLVVIMVFA